MENNLYYPNISYKLKCLPTLDIILGMGEHTSKSDGTFRIPAHHLSLGQTPFADVHRLFSERPKIDEVPGVWPTFPARQPRMTSSTPDYGVMTSFNSEQLPYIITALNYLNRLMMGEVYGDQAVQPIPSLQERMIEDTATNYPLSFQGVVKQAIEDTMEDFSDLYPNLTPALFHSFFGVGTQGIRQALVLSANYLDLVRTGSLTTDNLKSVQIPKSEFSKQHPKNRPPGENPLYEMHCIGEKVARTILNQSAQAAIRIVMMGKDEGIDSSVLDKKEIERDISFLAHDLLLEAERREWSGT